MMALGVGEPSQGGDIAIRKPTHTQLIGYRYLLKTWFIFFPASDLLIQLSIPISVCHVQHVLVPARGTVILK